MAEKKKKSHPVPPHAILTAHEVCKTLRYLIVCGLVAFIVWQLSVCFQAYIDKPAWLELVTLLVGTLIGPSGLFLWLVRRTRRYTARSSARQVELEAKVDSHRSTSGLLPDGTNKPEDRL